VLTIAPGRHFLRFEDGRPSASRPSAASSLLVPANTIAIEAALGQLEAPSYGGAVLGAISLGVGALATFVGFVYLASSNWAGGSSGSGGPYSVGGQDPGYGVAWLSVGGVLLALGIWAEISAPGVEQHATIRVVRGRR
jgi:hypothetical protein